MEKFIPIKTLSFEFALKVISLYKLLVNLREYEISKQLLRAGTSIGSNVAEAGAAQTKRDFISKMSIASKEARETKYWLQLLDKSKIGTADYSTYLSEIDSIINILTKIVKSSQESLSQP